MRGRDGGRAPETGVLLELNTVAKAAWLQAGDSSPLDPEKSNLPRPPAGRNRGADVEVVLHG